MNRIIIIVGFARCGVTLVNRYLASDPELICLSEINSRCTCPTEPNTARTQLEEWYDISIEEGTTMQELKSLFSVLNESKKTLIIRDWSFGSFTALKYNNFNPSYKLNTVDDIVHAFPKAKVDIIAIARNPIDVWLSMNSSVKTFHDKKLEAYNSFIDDVIERGIRIFKYEDFCKDKNKILSEIYKVADKEMSTGLSLSSNVIGDINYPGSSRGAGENATCILERRDFSYDDWLFMKESTCIDEILRKLCYENEL